MSDPETLGAELVAARNRRDLTLDQVERQTRIRAHYLAALEENNYALLPSAVQGRGFLRNYARFLGLDVDDCERRFNATLQTSARRGRAPTIFADDPTLPTVSRRTPTNRPGSLIASSANSSGSSNRPVDRPTTARNGRTVTAPASVTHSNRPEQSGNARRNRTRNMTLGTVGIVGASLIVLTLILMYSNHMVGVGAPASPIMSPLPSTVIATSTASATITLTPDRPSPLPNLAASSAVTTVGGIAIQITARERAPLRISVDDQVVYSGVPAANTVLKYQAKTSIQVHTGDAGAIDISINGVPQPPIGEVHGIADKVYTLATINASPAPTAIPSPTDLSGAFSDSPLPPSATVFIASKP